MTNTKSAGYSGKPLSRKLGFKPGWTVRVVNPPEHYPQLVSDATDVAFAADAVQPDAAHLFVHGEEDVARAASDQIARLREGGMLWVSWAKKSSKLHAGITEDDLRAAILPLGWVDVKVCAVDADWSALKFLRRKG